MDKVSIAKRQFRMEEWRKRITECQASGIAVTHWCKQNGYCEQTYYKYLKKFREEVVDNLPVPITEQPKPVSFKKLEVQTPVTGTQAAVVIRLNGATVEVNLFVQNASIITQAKESLLITSIIFVIFTAFEIFVLIKNKS